MAILTILIESILGSGDSIKVQDTTDWTQTDAGERIGYGLYLYGTYRLSSEPEDVAIAYVNPLTVEEWIAATPVDGRYTLASYAFPVFDEMESPTEGMTRVDGEGVLIRYTVDEWVEETLVDAIAAESYAYVSDSAEVPLLSHAYAFRNTLNLKYVTTVKNDIAHGAHQNEMYYKRTELDYYYGLILAAEYNWYQQMYENFYNITDNLINILNTGKLS